VPRARRNPDKERDRAQQQKKHKKNTTRKRKRRWRLVVSFSKFCRDTKPFFLYFFYFILTHDGSASCFFVCVWCVCYCPCFPVKPKASVLTARKYSICFVCLFVCVCVSVSMLSCGRAHTRTVPLVHTHFFFSRRKKTSNLLCPKKYGNIVNCYLIGFFFPGLQCERGKRKDVIFRFIKRRDRAVCSVQ
jgi:Na+/melibiose symporter-like transporter